MKEKRDLKVGIKSDKEFFDELKDLAGRIDDGRLPEKPVERLYFDDLPSLLKHLTPKRFELLAELRSMGHSSINALAKHLHRQYRMFLMMSRPWSVWGWWRRIPADIFMCRGMR